MRHSVVFCLVTLFGVCAGAAEPEILRRDEMLRRKPDGESSSVRVWTIRNNGVGRTNLVEMLGCLPLHLHPDADHSLLVLRGEVRVKAGSIETVLREGDYITIPPNVPHGYQVIGESALLVSMDAPFYDSRNTVGLERDCSSWGGGG